MYISNRVTSLHCEPFTFLTLRSGDALPGVQDNLLLSLSCDGDTFDNFSYTPNLRVLLDLATLAIKQIMIFYLKTVRGIKWGEKSVSVKKNHKQNSDDISHVYKQQETNTHIYNYASECFTHIIFWKQTFKAYLKANSSLFYLYSLPAYSQHRFTYTFSECWLNGKTPSN